MSVYLLFINHIFLILCISCHLYCILGIVFLKSCYLGADKRLIMLVPPLFELDVVYFELKCFSSKTCWIFMLGSSELCLPNTKRLWKTLLCFSIPAFYHPHAAQCLQMSHGENCSCFWGSSIYKASSPWKDIPL